VIDPIGSQNQESVLALEKFRELTLRRIGSYDEIQIREHDELLASHVRSSATASTDRYVLDSLRFTSLAHARVAHVLTVIALAVRN
jgi:hypothetical protein